jgi:hypothetical protein
MSRGLRFAAAAVLVFAVAFAAAQLIRPARINPVTNHGETIQALMGTRSGLVSVLNRACRDCHSNETAWSKYSRVSPLSWLVAYGVAGGRKALNFSTWSRYSPEQRRDLLAESCRDAASGKMPGSLYTMLYPDARLSAHDVETICAAAR